MINYGKQYIDESDIKAVIDTLKSDFLTQGSKVPEFEEAIANKFGAKYSVAANSATSALHLSCLALDLGQNDILWTVPNTFVASANCALYCGAEIDFVDIDSRTWNICINKLKEKLIEADKNNSLPKILIPVHFAGQPTIQEEIWELSKKYNFRIIEDASHSLGASRNGNYIGNCKWSDITVFSFHPVKMITTGEGGMALTNDKKVAKKLDIFRSHGITRDLDLLEKNNFPKYYYEQHYLGFNYRLTDIQAALGISQLAKLDGFVSKRNSLALTYNNELAELPIEIPHISAGNNSSFHIYVITVKSDFLAYKSRDKIFQDLLKENIGVNLHYLPVHLHPYYKKMGFQEGQFKVAENYANTAITIPLYYSLKNNEQEIVINAIRKILK